MDGPLLKAQPTPLSPVVFMPGMWGVKACLMHPPMPLPNLKYRSLEEFHASTTDCFLPSGAVRTRFRAGYSHLRVCQQLGPGLPRLPNARSLRRSLRAAGDHSFGVDRNRDADADWCKQCHCRKCGWSYKFHDLDRGTEHVSGAG